MIQHFLNGTEVFTEKETSIKITKENPVLTDSGSYTLDVNFPLSIPENKKFFGALNRIEVSKSFTTYDLVMKNNGIPLLVGTANLTKVTEDTVTVQYLAGNSNLNFWNKADEQYIDEYDYNTENGVDIVQQWMTSMGMDKGTMVVGSYLWGKYYESRSLSQSETNLFFGVKGKFVAAQYYDEDKEDDVEEISKLGNFLYGGNGTIRSWVFIFKTAHPNLLYIAERLCEMRGYSVDMSYLSNTEASNIYIGSAIPTTKLATTLPHWTVKEFFQEFCNFFNVTLAVDDVSKKVTVIDNKSFYSEETVLDEIEDIHEIEVSEEALDSNVMTSDVGYKETNNKMQNVGESTRKKYPTYEAEGWDDAKTVYKEVQDNWAFYGKGADICTFDSSGNEYTIDIFRPLDRGSDNSFELKIVPAKTDQKDLLIHKTTTTDTGIVATGEGYNTLRYGKKETTTCFFYSRQRLLSLENGYGGYKVKTGSLYEDLNGEEVEDGNGEKEDYMPVFMMSGYYIHQWAYKEEIIKQTDYYKQTKQTVNEEWSAWEWINEEGHQRSSTTTEAYDVNEDMDFYVYIPYTDRWYDGWQYPDNTNSIKCENSLAIAGKRTGCFIFDFHNSTAEYNNNSILQVNFMARQIPKVYDVYVIRNKRYLCQKIEVEIKDDGINPLMTGYFIEIKG